MKDQKNQILEALTIKHIELIEKGKLNTIAGGIVICEPIAT